MQQCLSVTNEAKKFTPFPGRVQFRSSLHEFIPIDRIDLRVMLSVGRFLAANLEVLLGHRKARLGSKLRLHHSNELFVVSDYNELEVALLGTRGNDLSKSNGKSTLVVVVQIDWEVQQVNEGNARKLMRIEHRLENRNDTCSLACRFIEGNTTAVDTKRLCKCQPDDNTSKNALTRTASTSHVELRTAF